MMMMMMMNNEIILRSMAKGLQKDWRNTAFFLQKHNLSCLLQNLDNLLQYSIGHSQKVVHD